VGKMRFFKSLIIALLFSSIIIQSQIVEASELTANQKFSSQVKTKKIIAYLFLEIIRNRERLLSAG
jgi:hypothetical protein